jgi:outer membrane protein assembly factor BamA
MRNFKPESFFGNYFRLFMTLLLVFALASCSPTKRIQRRGGYHHVSNNVVVDRKGISNYDLMNFAQPKPTPRFLGVVRNGVLMYEWLSVGKQTKTKVFFKKLLGRPPSVLDSALVDNALTPMTIYLNNKGYFGATVSRSINLKKDKSRVTYYTHTSEPFKFGDITYIIADDSLRFFMENIGKTSLLKTGNQYDAYLIRDERERMTKELRDIGYYAFSREYVFFEIDTTRASLSADVSIRIENIRPLLSPKGDTISAPQHIRYFVNRIFVNSNFADHLSDNQGFDTLIYRSGLDTSRNKHPDFYQIYRSEVRLRPVVIARSLFLKPGQPFNQNYINYSYNRLQNLGLTRFVSLNVNPSENAENQARGYGLLDYDIRMVRADVNMFTIEAEGTNAGGYLGLGSSINYRNRNIFRGAETLRLKARSAFEIAPDLGIETSQNNTIFNTLETGIESGIDFPMLLTPFPVKKLGINTKAKTAISLGFNYQLRKNSYARYLSYLTFGYEWNASLAVRHMLTPLEISSVSITRDSTFNDYLSQLSDPRFLSQYTDHLVMAARYSFIFNNQELNVKDNHVFFRFNIETAGNILNLYSSLSSGEINEEGNYTLFGIRYAQYFRTDFDLRFYHPTGKDQNLVFRTAFGIGVPYGNSEALPFEKAFFAGGANGLRGWQVRSLGPGEYYSTNKTGFERVGDIWFEGNVEYRFPLYSFLTGGIFADAGNIWLLKENESYPNGEFQPERLFKSLALDAGMGFRFDFSFFIFRIDGGLPIYDPGQLPEKRWLNLAKFQMKNINWNFGIGYPF